MPRRGKVKENVFNCGNAYTRLPLVFPCLVVFLCLCAFVVTLAKLIFPMSLKLTTRGTGCVQIGRSHQPSK
jgi:hypothetical protein